jgi:hypothetical protein
MVSVYGDGRVISEGPVAAIWPGPALPNVQVRRIGTDDVRALVDRALAAGVGDTADLGRPGVADAATTRFTVVTSSTTAVRDVYALMEGASGAPPAGSGVFPQLTAEQQAARRKLLDLESALTDLDRTLGAVADAEPYAPRRSRPWSLRGTPGRRTRRSPSAPGRGPTCPGRGSAARPASPA